MWRYSIYRWSYWAFSIHINSYISRQHIYLCIHIYIYICIQIIFFYTCREILPTPSPVLISLSFRHTSTPPSMSALTLLTPLKFFSLLRIHLHPSILLVFISVSTALFILIVYSEAYMHAYLCLYLYLYLYIYTYLAVYLPPYK